MKELSDCDAASLRCFYFFPPGTIRMRRCLSVGRSGGLGAQSSQNLPESIAGKKYLLKLSHRCSGCFRASDDDQVVILPFQIGEKFAEPIRRTRASISYDLKCISGEPCCFVLIVTPGVVSRSWLPGLAHAKLTAIEVDPNGNPSISSPR